MGDIIPESWASRQSPQPFSSKTLSQGWGFRQKEISSELVSDSMGKNEQDRNFQKLVTSWHPVKKIPSVVHQDLIDNELLADPFVGMNETKAEWVGERTWVYRTRFTLPRKVLIGRQAAAVDNAVVGGVGTVTSTAAAAATTITPGRQSTRAVLAFDGLDTFAMIKVDGKVVLEADNMFRSWRVDITDLVGSDSDIKSSNQDDSRHETSDNYDNFHPKQNDEHDLEIEFKSALLKAREIKDQHPDHKWICWNGESARLAVRKAQYHWGWDWGPFLMCAGIWRDVRIEVYEARITDVRLDVQFGSSLKDVTVKVAFQTEGWDDVRAVGEEKEDTNFQSYATVTIRDPLSRPSSSIGLTKLFGRDKKDMQVKIEDPKLWWPSGLGDQNMYEFEVAIYSAQNVQLDTVIKQIGLRKLELIQDDDFVDGDKSSNGKSFYFRVNNANVFCAGSCWIPADSFLTNLTPQRYRDWIRLMVPANQNMIRVWGGGIYEDDAFYDACDELGILVWQDFMFACGNYPTFPDMLASVKAEAITNVRRIRHHPSLAIFAGNNEDYSVREQEGLTYDYEDKNQDNWLKTDFPARYIYEALLPEVVAAESPWTPYHPGSPWSYEKSTNDQSIGDLHQWNVWHGSQQKYQVYDKLGGRFNSEFGMEAFPNINTVRSFIRNRGDLYPQSQVMDFHNKAAGHERRIATYMTENVRIAAGLSAYIYLTQLIQSEALTYAYRGWRRQWGYDRKCGGALVWQLNDCWPATSWSVCDYYLRRKPSYYSIARTLAPIAVGVCREHHDWSESHARIPERQNCQIWGVNSTLHSIKVTVTITRFAIKTGELLSKWSPNSDHVVLYPNETTELGDGFCYNLVEEPHVVVARLLVDGVIVARDVDWPQPLKYLSFAQRQVKIRYEGDKIFVSAERPVKCLVFEERDGITLSDNALDIMPDDEQEITVRGLKEGDMPLTWTYLGADEQ